MLRAFAVIVVFVSTALSFHSIELNTLDLHKTLIRWVKSPLMMSERLRTPYAGEEELRVDIAEAADLFHRHHVEAYDVSPSYLGDQGPDQRLVEVVWATRYRVGAEYLLRRLSEVKAKHCVEVESKKHVVLDRCSP